jgi:sugar phosphate permease
VIGALGAAWVIAWLLLIRRGDVEKKDVSSDAPDSRNVSSTETRRNFWWQECLANPKFWAMVPVVVSINITWQLIRAWLPKFLQQGRGIPEAQSLWFNSAYYISADIGCISAGAIAMWLATRGMTVHRARVSVFLCCAVVVAIMTNAAAVLPRGPALYSVLLVVAAASMGLFPCYYSLAQDVSIGNVGKASGLLGTIGWLAASPMQKIFGRLVDSTGSFDTGLAVVGIPPVIAILWLMAIWPRLETTDATPWMNRSRR